MSDYEQYDFMDVHKALKKIRKQHRKGKPLVWTGPDRLHFSVAATSLPPSWYFSEEGLAYAKDQGRSFDDVWMQVAFQIGYHNGYVKADEDASFWRNMYDKEIGNRK